MTDAEMEQPRISGTVSIGEARDVLKGEFPDITISKIRFLGDGGLITFSRTTSGYRRFSQQDIDRLRAVLTLQRDQYLPLSVIKDHIEDDPVGAAVAGTGLAPEHFRPGAGRVRMTRSELADECGLEEAAVAQLEAIGLVHATPAGHYDEDALAIATIAAHLAQYGIEHRHLKSFRVVADREAGLVDQASTPYKNPRDREGREREQRIVGEVASLLVQLHAALLRADLVRAGRA